MKKMYLFEKPNYKDKRPKSSILWFNLQMATTAEVGPVKSFFLVFHMDANTQALGPSPAAFFGILAWSWVRSGVWV